MADLVLQKPHTHAGRSFPAGSRLDLSAATARWLIEHGIAVYAPLATSAAAPAKPSAKPKAVKSNAVKQKPVSTAKPQEEHHGE